MSVSLLIRAVAPSPAGPAMARPVLSSETGFLKIKAKHFKTVSDLGGGGGTNQSLQCSAF